jgi:hypothetical protein
MLTIENTQCEINAVTPVACKIGESYETKISLSLVLVTLASHLDEMEPGLRKALYKKVAKAKRVQDDDQGELLQGADDNLIEPRFAGKIPSIKWDDVLEGYTVTIGSGLTATDPRVFSGVKLKNFEIQAQNGGTIKMKFSGLFEADRETKGFLCECLRQTLQFSMHPPGDVQTELVQQEEFEEVD